MPIRSEPSELLRQNPVLAVLRAEDARDYPPVIEALADGNIRCIELTLTTQGVFDQLPSLSAAFGSSIEIGVGTVTTVDEASRALDAGARFLVTPVMSEAIVNVGVASGIPVFPGGLTPTELFNGWRAGATAVKIFPAAIVGAGYVSQLRGPFPDIQVIPSGGVGVADVAPWIAAGAMAVSLGGPLLGDAFQGGNLQLVKARALEVSRIAAEAVAKRGSR
jgi:2-dehydro-3-deoxyphosphogluconate aldolase/(4S)-4-hydroxy-2-oxoglutarate aldolase